MINSFDIESVAASLFDGGWRAEDREDLIEEYELTEEEADAICSELDKFENHGKEHTHMFRFDSELYEKE